MSTESHKTASQIHEKWFDEMIATLKAHQLQLETETASVELMKFYETLIGGNLPEMTKLGRETFLKYFVAKIILEYLEKIKSHLPSKLAFDFNDSEVLVWAEIEDDDLDMERKLLVAEAQINARFHEFGLDMESTIVEKSDNLSIPNHYHIYKD